MNENLTPNVRAYAAERQFLIAESLGSGKDGIVWVAKSQTAPAKVALKAHRFSELYLREKAAYQRLDQRAIHTILGFNVPELLGFDDRLWILEMTIVKRPFVLDFAGAHLLECCVRLPDIMPAGCVCECVGELGGKKWEKLAHFVHDVLRVVAQLHPCPLETQSVVRITSCTSLFG